jgi:DNA (cytosine-5)-methyltransferase 1
MKSLPSCEILVAGWPCQDLSQAGRMTGIHGDHSGLVTEIFRLIRAARKKPTFVVLENVAFALHLQEGRALKYVTGELEELGYAWAYRILDTRNFGLPQRRRRLFIVASRSCDPAGLLFDGQTDEQPHAIKSDMTGFYWTEGNTGIGWSPGAMRGVSPRNVALSAHLKIKSRKSP